jgi:hypothetical protein
MQAILVANALMTKNTRFSSAGVLYLPFQTKDDEQKAAKSTAWRSLARLSSLLAVTLFRTTRS